MTHLSAPLHPALLSLALDNCNKEIGCTAVGGAKGPPGMYTQFSDLQYPSSTSVHLPFQESNVHSILACNCQLSNSLSATLPSGPNWTILFHMQYLHFHLSLQYVLYSLFTVAQIKCFNCACCSAATAEVD